MSPPPPPAPSSSLFSALDAAADHFALLTDRAVIHWASRGLATQLGEDPSVLIGRAFASVAVPVDRSLTLERVVAQVAETLTPIIFEAMVRGAAGLRIYEYVASPVPGGPPARVLVAGRETTARRQQLARLSESEEFFRLIFEHGPVGIAIASTDRRILRANARFSDISGYNEAELSARRLDDLAVPEEFADESPRLAALQEGALEAYQLECRMTRKDGSRMWTRVTRAAVLDGEGEVLYIISLTEDIDARRRSEARQHAMEERLRERHKLESLGVLAGGIAHDLNNLLVPILGNAELALKAADDALQAHLLEEIVLASQRAARLARQMQAYSGRGHFVMAPVDLSSLVEEMGSVLRASAPRSVGIDMQTEPHLPAIRADALQMRQIVFNLVQNATEALGTGTGQITVSTGCRSLTHEMLESLYVPGDLPAGDYVYLRIADSGAGISAEVRPHLFDPFHSTKGPGRGLGLPAVLGIVRGHGGALEVRTDPKDGTAITVYFPTETTTTADREVVAPSRSARVGMVLLVAEDDALRGLGERTLARAGYDVRGAATPMQALACLREGEPVACLVVDLEPNGVQGISGWEELTRIAGDLPLVTVGTPPESAAALTADAARLPRPFTPRALRRAVEQALGGTPTDEA